MSSSVCTWGVGGSISSGGVVVSSGGVVVSSGGVVVSSGGAVVSSGGVVVSSGGVVVSSGRVVVPSEGVVVSSGRVVVPSEGVVTAGIVSSGVVCTVTIGVVMSSLLGESDPNMLTPTTVPVVATAAVTATVIHVFVLTPFRKVIAVFANAFDVVVTAFKLAFRPVFIVSKLIFFITIHFHVSARRHFVRILYHIFRKLSIFLPINRIYPTNRAPTKKQPRKCEKAPAGRVYFN